MLRNKISWRTSLNVSAMKVIFMAMDRKKLSALYKKINTSKDFLAIVIGAGLRGSAIQHIL